jgi:hypothetical protein
MPIILNGAKEKFPIRRQIIPIFPAYFGFSKIITG